MRHIECRQKFRALDFCSLEIGRIVKSLVETRYYRGALSQTRENETVRGNGEKVVRTHVNNGLRSRSFAIRLLNGWNKKPEETGAVGSVREF